MARTASQTTEDLSESQDVNLRVWAYALCQSFPGDCGTRSPTSHQENAATQAWVPEGPSAWFLQTGWHQRWVEEKVEVSPVLIYLFFPPGLESTNCEFSEKGQWYYACNYHIWSPYIKELIRCISRLSVSMNAAAFTSTPSLSSIFFYFLSWMRSCI